MRLLILTQYYPPEIGAPQNRLHELAIRLKKRGVQVDVLTAMPNYPKMEIDSRYLSGNITEEVIDDIRVFRSKIYVSKSKGILARLRNYFSFVRSSYRRGKQLGDYDFLLVESPPLFLGYSAMRLAKLKNAKLIFNVSDLWPESAEKMGIVTNKLLLKKAYNLEAKCYNNSVLVTGQTMGIVENINTRFPNVKTHWLPNGVDIDFYNPDNFESQDFRNEHGFADDDLLFFYGGILGHAQGLQTVLKAAEKIKNQDKIKIIIQGTGPEKDELISLCERLQLSNVLFLPPVPKIEMPKVLSSVDVALIPLRKLDIFQGAIPSKVFESLAMRKPLLLGVDGEAKRHFIENAKAGLYFEPENDKDLSEKLLEMLNDPESLEQMGNNARKYVVEHFNRDNIAEEFLTVLESY